jgi:hypothetical protein
MTHFPHPKPDRRATRIQLSTSAPALIRLGDGRRAKARIKSVSLTGGLLQLGRALGEGDFVEVAFHTQSGPVHGMAEMLNPERPLTDGVLQPFRFIAMEDNDHRTLSLAVDQTADRNFLLGPNQYVPERKH